MTIRRLVKGHPRLTALTFPRYCHLVTAPQENVALLAAGHEEDPSGLALVQLGLADAAARLLSVYVPQSRRRQGIGLAIIEAAEAVARQAGARTLYASYSSVMKGAPALEATLTKAGWPPARVESMRIRGAAGWAESAYAEWGFLFERLRRSGFTIDDWTSVSAGDRAGIQAVLNSGLVRSDFDPFPFEDRHIPELSLVLRRNGEITGWVQGVPEAGDTGAVCYVNGAVLADFTRSGLLIAAIVDASRRQAALMGPASICVWQTDADNQAMRSFMDRRLGPRGPQHLDLFQERTQQLTPCQL